MPFEDALLKYGLPGIFIVILIIAIKWGAGFVKDLIKDSKTEREEQENQHRRERETWNLINQRQLDETNKNIKENTNILSSLKTLLESRK